MLSEAVGGLGQDDALAQFTLDLEAAWPTNAPVAVEELQARFAGKDFIRAWSIPGTAVEVPRDLLLLLPRLFPFELPRIALREPPGPAELPHVEVDGLLCLVPDGSLMRLPVTIEHAKILVSDAVKVIREGLAGTNHGDFLDEISTYWVLGQPFEPKFWMVSPDLLTTRELVSLRFADAVVFADKQAELTTWVENLGRRVVKPEFQRACLIELPNGLLPPQYPRSSTNLEELITAAGPTAVATFVGCLAPKQRVNVIFTFAHGGERAAIGISLQVGSKSRPGAIGSTPLWEGFRPNKLPAAELLRRVSMANIYVARSVVESVGAGRLLKRTAGACADGLKAASVAVIGCGALGATVAKLLLTAGVRRLVLVDGDHLTWQNVGRHELSGAFVGQNKAESLRKRLLQSIPDADITAYGESWQDAWSTKPEFLKGCELAIAMTGDWPSDSLMNRLASDGLLPPTIFGWVEAQGLAGHALTALWPGACLECMADALGAFSQQVADVPDIHRAQREHSCGSFYQPFSALTIAPVAAMLAATAIDSLQGQLALSELRTWIASRASFDTVDAKLMGEWAERVRKGGFERTYRLSLPRVQHCPVCGSVERLSS